MAEADTNDLEDRLNRSAGLFAEAVEALSGSGSGIDSEGADALVRRAQTAMAEFDAAELALAAQAQAVSEALDREWRQAMDDEEESARSSRRALFSRRKETTVPAMALVVKALLPHLSQADAALDASLAQRRAIADFLVPLEAALGSAGEAAKADRRALDAARQEKDEVGRRELELRDALADDEMDGEDLERLHALHAEAVTAYSETQQQTLALERQVEADERGLEAFEALTKRANRHLSALDAVAALCKTEIERAVLLLAASSDDEPPALEGHPAHAMELMRDGLLSAQDMAARRQQAARAFASRVDPATSDAIRPEDGSTT